MRGCPICGNELAFTFSKLDGIIQCTDCLTYYSMEKFSSSEYVPDSEHLFDTLKDWVKNKYNSNIHFEGKIEDYLEAGQGELDEAETSKSIIISNLHTQENPGNYLSQLRQKFDENDELFGIVPNFDNFTKRAIPEKLSNFIEKEQKLFLTIDSLNKLFHASGFELVDYFTKIIAKEDIIDKALKEYFRSNPTIDKIEFIESLEKQDLGNYLFFKAKKTKRKFNITQDKPDLDIKQNSLDNPDVSIVIPLYNQLNYTQQVFENITKVNSGISNENIEVIFVDNASNDETENYLDFLHSLYKNITVIKSGTNVGFSRACNIGAEYSKGKYLVFLNNDTKPLSNWILKGISDLDENPDIGIVGGKLLYSDDSVQHAGVKYMPYSHPKFHYYPQHRYVSLPKDDELVNISGYVDAVTGAFMMMRKEDFFAVDGFSTEYKMYFEDMDLCMKIKNSGKNIFYDSEIEIYHYEGKSSGSNKERANLSNESASIFFTKWKDYLDQKYQLDFNEHFESIKDVVSIQTLSNIARNKYYFEQLFKTNRKKEALDLLSILINKYEEIQNFIVVGFEKYLNLGKVENEIR